MPASGDFFNGARNPVFMAVLGILPSPIQQQSSKFLTSGLVKVRVKLRLQRKRAAERRLKNNSSTGISYELHVDDRLTRAKSRADFLYCFAAAWKLKL